jgi:Rrf2 family transcriptional regulator, iron-sulfur cluster assembly transcription factor
MLVTAATRYAIRAVFDLAFYGDGSPVKIRDISLRQEISERYLEQIFFKLLRAGLIRGKRGPNGGYVLAKDPIAISVADIISAIEGRHLIPVPVKCLSQENPDSGTCGMIDRCITRHVWKRTHALLEDYYNSVSVADLCSLARVEGIPNGNENSGTSVL